MAYGYGTLPAAGGGVMRNYLEPGAWQPQQNTTQTLQPITTWKQNPASPPTLGNDGTTWKPYTPPPQGDVVTGLWLGGGVDRTPDPTNGYGANNPYSPHYVNPNGSGQQAGLATTTPMGGASNPMTGDGSTYNSNLPAPGKLYSDQQTSTAMNRIRGQGAQAAATAMMPRYRDGLAGTSPAAQWGRAAAGSAAWDNTMSGMGQQYLGDQQANATHQTAWELARLNDVLGQAGANATIGQLNTAYQGNMLRQLLGGINGAFGNLGQLYQDQIGDNAFWSNYGLRQNATNQGNMMSGMDWLSLLGAF